MKLLRPSAQPLKRYSTSKIRTKFNTVLSMPSSRCKIVERNALHIIEEPLVITILGLNLRSAIYFHGNMRATKCTLLIFVRWAAPGTDIISPWFNSFPADRPYLTNHGLGNLQIRILVFKSHCRNAFPQLVESTWLQIVSFLYVFLLCG